MVWFSSQRQGDAPGAPNTAKYDWFSGSGQRAVEAVVGKQAEPNAQEAMKAQSNDGCRSELRHTEAYEREAYAGTLLSVLQHL